MARFRLVFPVLLLLVLPLRALELHIEPVDTRPGECRFRYVYDDVVDEAPDRRQRHILKGLTPTYIVWLDPDAIQKEKFDIRFNYEFYAQPKSGGPVRRIDVEATPKGDFADQSVLVKFRLVEGTQSEEGQMTLPVFGESVAEALKSEAKSEKAYLADERKFGLELKNVSRNWVDIREVSASGDTDLWDSVTVERTGHPIRLESEQTTGDGLKVVLKPKLVQSFVRAFTPRPEDALDDTITTYVTYDTRARSGRQHIVKIPVRFEPWIPQLFLSVLLGAFVGSLVPRSARGKSWRDRLRAFGAAVVVAVIAELLAMALKATKTEVRIFGFDLDPFQLPTAALIGVFIGMAGYRSAALFRRAFESRFWQRGGE